MSSIPAVRAAAELFLSGSGAVINEESVELTIVSRTEHAGVVEGVIFGSKDGKLVLAVRDPSSALMRVLKRGRIVVTIGDSGLAAD